MNSYINLAKKAVENYIKKEEIIKAPKDLPKEFFQKKSGVFVSIYIRSTKSEIQNPKYKLRGCIGTYLPTKENIAKEIIHNAVAAATEDYRFGPIQKEELPYLTFTVYILSEPEIVRDIKELNPEKYGIIVKTVSPKTGLLLPDLEGIDTIEKQIYTACQKGGIDPNIEKLIIYKFTVEKYK